MAVSNYRRGADLERALVRRLRAHGWEAARSASSKSAVDVWAAKSGVVRLYQCSLKRTAAKERAVNEATNRIGVTVSLVTKLDLDLTEVD
jgi:Holliday junction resolvase